MHELERLYPGVAFKKPESVFIDEGARVSIEGGAIVHPNVCFYGTVVVRHGCEIRAGSVLQNCNLGSACCVGPFAFIREYTVLEHAVRLGAYAEVKHAYFESGARMDHHGYVGDAWVGAHTTIGAGVVTANFDGKQKHHTIIGCNALIGINASLVAPVTIGDNAIVAAGSVITKDVPSNHIAFGRARQVNRKWMDWASTT